MGNGQGYIFFILLVTLLFTSPVKGGEIGKRLLAELGRLGSEAEVDVILYFRSADESIMEKLPTVEMRKRQLGTLLRSRAALSQKRVKRMLETKSIDTSGRIWSVNGLAVRVPVSLVSQISVQPEIDRIELDRKLTLKKDSPASQPTSISWNLEAIGADKIWEIGIDGTGVVVGVMDSGIDYNHQGLNANWRGGENSWYDPHDEHLTPYDRDGHGTQVTGVLLGTSTGVAPGAKWIGVKIFNDQGESTVSNILLGFQWLLDPDNNPLTEDMPHIVNNSWGFAEQVGQCLNDFTTSIQLLKASGIAVVFSAGNTGPLFSTSISPANYPESFAVGGIDSDLSLASYSARGPSTCDEGLYPEIVAPGSDILTADLTFGGLFPDNTAVVSGTSFAAPHISGAMALLKQKYPWVTVNELEHVLQQSALDLEELGPDNTSGYGLVDLVSAFSYVENNLCDGPAGPFIAENCDEPPVTPPGENMEFYPALHLLLGEGRDATNDLLLMGNGNNLLSYLNNKHEGYYEVTQ